MRTHPHIAHTVTASSRASLAKTQLGDPRRLAVASRPVVGNRCFSFELGCESGASSLRESSSAGPGRDCRRAHGRSPGRVFAGPHPATFPAVDGHSVSFPSSTCGRCMPGKLDPSRGSCIGGCDAADSLALHTWCDLLLARIAAGGIADPRSSAAQFVRRRSVRRRWLCRVRRSILLPFADHLMRAT